MMNTTYDAPLNYQQKTKLVWVRNASPASRQLAHLSLRAIPWIPCFHAPQAFLEVFGTKVTIPPDAIAIVPVGCWSDILAKVDWAQRVDPTEAAELMTMWHNCAETEKLIATLRGTITDLECDIANAQQEVEEDYFCESCKTPFNGHAPLELNAQCYCDSCKTPAMLQFLGSELVTSGTPTPTDIAPDEPATPTTRKRR